MRWKKKIWLKHIAPNVPEVNTVALAKPVIIVRIALLEEAAVYVLRVTVPAVRSVLNQRQVITVVAVLNAKGLQKRAPGVKGWSEVGDIAGSMVSQIIFS